ncbi:MAG: ATP-binding protein [Pseudomonadales bacterium]|jgi:anti-sigma regulatory factor (Ser/Thr protein kinase)
MLLTCQREINELERIVDQTSQFFETEGISQELKFVVDLAMEELFVNMVKYNTETDKQIAIELLSLPQGIEVSLTDFDVEKFNPTTRVEVDIEAPAQARTPGGLGIFLVLKMVDSIYYEYKNRVSKITFRKYTEST